MKNIYRGENLFSLEGHLLYNLAAYCATEIIFDRYFGDQQSKVLLVKDLKMGRSLIAWLDPVLSIEGRQDQEQNSSLFACVQAFIKCSLGPLNFSLSQLELTKDCEG